MSTIFIVVYVLPLGIQKWYHVICRLTIDMYDCIENLEVVWIWKMVFFWLMLLTSPRVKNRLSIGSHQSNPARDRVYFYSSRIFSVFGYAEHLRQLIGNRKRAINLPTNVHDMDNFCPSALICDFFVNQQ